MDESKADRLRSFLENKQWAEAKGILSNENWTREEINGRFVLNVRQELEREYILSYLWGCLHNKDNVTILAGFIHLAVIKEAPEDVFKSLLMHTTCDVNLILDVKENGVSKGTTTALNLAIYSLLLSSSSLHPINSSLNTMKLLLTTEKCDLKLTHFEKHPVHLYLSFSDNYEHLEILNMILQQTEDINVQDDKGRTPLWNVMDLRNQNIHLFNLLIGTYRADILRKTNSGETLLHHFVEHYQYCHASDQTMNFVNEMWELCKFGEMINEKDENGDTPIYFIFAKRTSIYIETIQVNLAQLILQQEEMDLSVENNDGMTVFHCLAENWFGNELWHKVFLRIEDIFNELLDKRRTEELNKLYIWNNKGQKRTVMHSLISGWFPEHYKVRILQKFLNKNADVNIADSEGCTVLHRIAENSRDKERLLLPVIKATEDINKQSNDGRTALHFAVTTDYSFNSSIISTLLSEGANVDIPDHGGLTAVHMALSTAKKCTQYPLTEVYEVLKKSKDINKQCGKGKTPSHIAIGDVITDDQNHHEKELIFWLLKEGACVDIPDEEGVTSLHMAAKCKNFPKELFEVLVKNSKDIDKKCDKGKTALTYVIYDKPSTFVEILLEKNASVDVQDNEGFTPLHCQVIFKEIKDNEILNTMLTKSNNVNIQNKCDGETVLHYLVNAVRTTGKIDTYIQDKDGKHPLHFLIEFNNNSETKLPKLNPDILDNEGRTPLCKALNSRDFEYAKILLDLGCDINIQSPHTSMGAIHYLAKVDADCSNINIEVSNAIVKKTRDVNTAAKQGQLTPLHFAVKNRKNPFSRQLVSELLKRSDCNPIAEDEYGQTPLQLMNFFPRPEDKDPEILQMLQNAEKKYKPENIDRKIHVEEKEMLGQGRFGVVYKGRFDMREVAVKKVWKEQVELIETDVLRKIDDHPNVVRYFYSELVGEIHYIALELCDYTLQEYLKKYNTVDLKQKKSILHQMLDGVNHLHNNEIVHGDLKPDNILILGDRVKLSDFGLSRKLSPTGEFSHVTGSYAGMEIWTAPELLQKAKERGKKKGTFTADIFSAGLIIYCVSTDGVHPFSDAESKSLFNEPEEFNNQAVVKNILCGKSERKDGVSHELHDLTCKMTKKEESERISASVAMRHPFFWSAKRTLEFYHEVSLKVNANEFKCLDYVKKTVQIINDKDPELNDRKWLKCLEDSPATKKYCSGAEDTVCYLIKKIRNIKEHYNELKPRKIKVEIGSFPDGVNEFFSKKFPSLLIHVYNTVDSYLFPGLPDNDQFKRNFFTESSKTLKPGHNFAVKRVQQSWRFCRKHFLAIAVIIGILVIILKMGFS